MVRGAPCSHCQATGLCSQVCCTIWHNVRLNGDKVIRICMICRGSAVEQAPRPGAVRP